MVGDLFRVDEVYFLFEVEGQFVGFLWWCRMSAKGVVKCADVKSALLVMIWEG